MEDPLYPDRVRFIPKGKEAGSEIIRLYCRESVRLPPPAVVPVAEMVKDWEPTTLVAPLISPVVELIDRPGGRPVAEKEPLQENPMVCDKLVSFFAKRVVPSGSFRLIGPIRAPKFR